MNGCEWIVEAHGCDPEALSDPGKLGKLFATMIEDLRLRPVGDAVWHRFPSPGGITGLLLLAESHLACHTFPEFGSLCLSLFCCRARPAWDFGGYLSREFGAEEVRVRALERPFSTAETQRSQEISAS